MSPRGFIPTVWGWFGSRRENLQDDLDKDLRDMGDLYSSRAPKGHDGASPGSDGTKAIKKIAVKIMPLPIPTSRKRKKRPLYHDVHLVQTDLFKFFPHNQSELFDFFEKDLPRAKVNVDPDEDPGTIRRPGHARSINGQHFWSANCPVCGEVNEIPATFGNGSNGREGWIPDQIGPLTRQCKHYDSRILMRLNPDYYFRNPDNEPTLLEIASGKVVH